MERLFIAIKIQDADKLYPLVRNTRIHLRNERMRWIPDKDLHITLRFLGNVEAGTIPHIKKAINSVVREFDDFYIQLKGLGNFGSRILWTGIEYNPELLDLQERIDEALLPWFEKEYREYVPHLTLARIKHLHNKSRFFKIIDANRENMLDYLHIHEICLMKSELRLVGPVYSVVQSFPLNVHEKANCH